MVHDVALGDYGSDLNAMPDTTFKKIVAALENIPAKFFDNPVEVVGACKTNEEKFTFSKLATLNITLMLPDSKYESDSVELNFIQLTEKWTKLCLFAPCCYLWDSTSMIIWNVFIL